MSVAVLTVILAFLSISSILVALFRQEKKWIGLLLSSVLFYSLLIGYKFVIIIILSLVFFYGGIGVYKNKIKLFVPVVIVLFALIIQKITADKFDFDALIEYSFDTGGEKMITDIIQIVGLSYFCFNGISYLIDISRKYAKPETNYFKFLLYLIYFPAVSSGPLHRSKELLPQFSTVQISAESVTKGGRLLLWGLFKYFTIAPRLLIFIASSKLFDTSGYYSLIVGLFLNLYIFINFSSFVDLSQGISQIFNIRLNDNFHPRVYLSSSRSEFWKGWHITLNAWFRDYFFFIYFRYAKNQLQVNVLLFATFLLISLWHEISVKFLVWGVLSGFWMISERWVMKRWKPNFRYARQLGIIYTLFFCSLLSLVFYSSNLEDLVKNLIGDPHISLVFLRTQVKNIAILLCCFLIMHQFAGKFNGERVDIFLSKKSGTYRWFFYTILVLCITLFAIQFSAGNIYAQF